MPSAASRAPYLALAHRDYRRLIASQLLSLTGTQMQVVAINWHVYLLTKSPLALGFVGLTRVVPIVIFSLWGGVVACTTLATAVGFALGDAVSDELRAAIDGFAAGALLVMLVDSMIPEAARKAGRAAGLVTVLGFAVAAGLS